MDFVRGIPREQGILFPERLDDYIEAENPVRFIEAFVEELDLKALGFHRTSPSWTGRSAYDPGDLLKLYIYGYLNKIRSSRKLEKETHRNVEVMWLLGKLHPDHKTIADFRKDNRKAFKGVFRAFGELCRRLNLFGGELVAVDGSKFKAVNNPKRHFTQDKLKKRLEALDQKIDQYLQDLDAADTQEAPRVGKTNASLKEKIQQMKEQKETYTRLLSDLQQRGETQVSLTDPDSRSMPKSPNAKIGYNVQIAVDDKHHLIVEQDVTNDANDKKLLSQISKQAKVSLKVEALTVVADSGYYNGEEIKACQADGITPYVPQINTSSSKSAGRFGKERFHYDAQKDGYLCPGGQMLTFSFLAIHKRKSNPEHLEKHYTTPACKTCALKTQCTTNPKGRCITRWVDEDILEKLATRLKENPHILHQRGRIVEHPFGTLKFWNDQYHFLVKGMEKVKAEFTLMTLGYNIKRVINMMGVPKMIEALS